MKSAWCACRRTRIAAMASRTAYTCAVLALTTQMCGGICRAASPLFRFNAVGGAIGTPTLLSTYGARTGWGFGVSPLDYQLEVASVAVGGRLDRFDVAAGTKLVETTSTFAGPGGFGSFLPIYVYLRTNPLDAPTRYGPAWNAYVGVFPWGGTVEGGYVSAGLGASWMLWAVNPGLEVNLRHEFFPSGRMWRDELSLRLRIDLGLWTRLW